MTNLTDSMKKYSENSSTEEIIRGLQDGGYIDGLNTPTEKPIYQNYLIALLNTKNNKELSITLNNFTKVVEEFSQTSSASAKVLNFWTKVLAFATVTLVFVTIVSLFKNF